MVLSSRSQSPFALVLGVSARPATTWNGRDVPPFDGFSDADQYTIWDTVRQALRWWNIDVTTLLPNKPCVQINFSNVFGGEPGGGQANVDSYKLGGVQAYVFVDVNQNNALYCGLDACHESGHVLGGFSDIIVNGVYQWGWWMGMPLNNPQWLQSQRDTLDQRFGPCGDLNWDGRVDQTDANILRQGQFSAAEAVNLARQYGSEFQGQAGKQ